MISQDYVAGRPSGAVVNASRRRLLLALGIGGFAIAATVHPLAAQAATVEDAVVELQHEWETIKYQTTNSEREKRFEALATKAHQVSETYAGRSEALIWEGIITASWAGAKGGLGALSLAKKAKAIYESAIRIDGNALEGSAYTSLAVLYYKVPGWPVSFGDKDKARELLQKGLSLNPKGIDSNFFFGELLAETDHADEAMPYLERALQAAPRPGRQISDAGRRDEVRALIAKIKAR
jgi:tetratricopeptide (TPR) repeat protein